MRIKSVRIKNFRSFEDQLITLDSYTCLLGPNGAGKSTLLSALNVFFCEDSNATPVDSLAAEDFHQKQIGEPVEITVTFHELSPRAQEALKDYYRNGELVVSAIARFEDEKGRAVVEQAGSRMAIADFARFFEAWKSGAPAGDLTQIFDELKEAYPGIPAPAGRSKDARRDALRAYEGDPANAHLLTPLRSTDQFYGIAGPSKLRPFIQWVYVPAVKDATDEQSESRAGALGKLLARTVHARVNFKTDLAAIEHAAQQQYQALMDANQGVLDEVATALSGRLSQWSHPEVTLQINWNSIPINVKTPTAKVLAGEQGFEGDLARFGHGFQRSYLLALLQELATMPGDDAPTLILGVEEPELYQHPPQARYLSQVLQQLATSGSQVVCTTHSPYFVDGSNFEMVRLFRKSPQTRATVTFALNRQRFSDRFAEVDEAAPLQLSAVETQLNQALRGGINEMFFATKLVLVEGPEDAAYIMTWMVLTGRFNTFRSQGVHIVPTEGKSNLARPLIVAQELKIPVFVVFDGDREKAAHAAQKTDNRRLLRILGLDQAPLFPDDPSWGLNHAQWPDELSRIVDAELSNSIGQAAFGQVMNESRQHCGFAADVSKHTMFVEKKLAVSHARGGACPTLDRLCDAILAL
ncbi:ATP-dependent nuclease [Stenotrophomonas maltophilia]|uniref:ATP-dependent nuclease n=1 Tax=Stenotrophomonas maltophilia TaxID=40324 RepID=UPI003916DD27